MFELSLISDIVQGVRTHHLCLSFQCREEAHRPVDCNTVHMWILKNCAESENMNWYEIRIFCFILM